MASIREQIMDAVVAALDGASKPASITVHRSRGRPIDDDDLPATVVYLRREDTADRATALLDRRTIIALEHRVSGDPVDTQLDALLVWGTAAMQADPTWGGLAYETTEQSTEWDSGLLQAQQRRGGGPMSAVFGAARQEFEIVHATQREDQESGP